MLLQKKYNVPSPHSYLTFFGNIIIAGLDVHFVLLHPILLSIPRVSLLIQ